MNIFEIFSINRHGDYQEILFSSALSYLLNPEYGSPASRQFLPHFLDRIGIPFEEEELGSTKVFSEYNLDDYGDGSVGKIDLLIESQRHLIGIELKIWDRSATNTSQEGIEQLIRYASALEAKASTEQEWTLLFIVPYYGAKMCATEYSKLNELYPGHALVFPLMSLKRDDQNYFDSLPGMLNTNLPSILGEFKTDKMVGDNKSQMLMTDMHDFLSNDIDNRLYRGNPDPQKFPSDCELKENCAEYYDMLIPFIQVTGRKANPVHTVIGCPYGTGEFRSRLHNNSLYRIRTTKDYYISLGQKEEFYPTQLLEIELWTDVYKACKEELHKWVESLSTVIDFQDSVHLDANKNIAIKLMQVKDILTTDQVREFESILRSGFKSIIEIAGK